MTSGGLKKPKVYSSPTVTVHGDIGALTRAVSPVKGGIDGKIAKNQDWKTG